LSFREESVRRQRLTRPALDKTVGEILTQLDVEIVNRSDRAKGFVAYPTIGSSNAQKEDTE
jgi:hypothetical protein